MKLKVDHLSVYAGDAPLVQDISFRLAENDALAIIGPSGSGKTTLLKALLGIHHRLFIKGSVFADDHLIEEDGIAITPLPRRRFGYIPQDLSLWPHLSVEQTLMRAQSFSVGRDKSRPNLPREQMLHDCGLDLLRHRLPASLSGGEKQRLALARALIGVPKLLVLDEPFSGLDLVMKDQLIKLINQLKATYGFSLIFVSHDLHESLAMARTMMIMDGGRKIWLGEKAELAPDCFLPHWNPLQSPMAASIFSKSTQESTRRL